MTLRTCIECGEISEAERCDEHRLKSRDRLNGDGHALNAQARGYDAAWNRLSKRARRLQPFCSDCGATEDLQCDHTPQAWARHAVGKVIRIKDVDVVCGPCNRRRGAARPGGRKPLSIRYGDGGDHPRPRGITTREGDAKFALHMQKYAYDDGS